MYKKLLVVFAVLVSTVSFSQEELKTFKNYLKTSFANIRGIVPIINEKNDDISFFFIDSKNIYGYLLNDNFKIKNQLISDKKSRKFKKLIGYSISENDKYRIYLTDKKNEAFVSIEFSYKDKNSTLSKISIDLKNEKFIQTVAYNNKFYLVTITKRSSIINIYSFDEKANYIRHELDFSDNKFILKNHISTLYELFRSSSNEDRSINVLKIKEDTPNSIEMTSANIKQYIRGSKLVFSFDINQKLTQILSINLDTYSKNVRHFEKPYFAEKQIFIKTNSYLSGDYIYQLSALDYKFMFTVKDFDTGNLIKSYSATREDSIFFKNSPIIQFGGSYKKFRELDKTKQFLRKMSSSKVGVSVYRYRDSIYQISLGGRHKSESLAPMMFFMGFANLPLATLGSGSFSFSIFFNPTSIAYNTYANTKSTYIKGLFNNNFEHIKGEIEKNAFDKIKDFKKKNKNQDEDVIFKYKNYYILGVYSRLMNLKLLKFSD